MSADVDPELLKRLAEHDARMEKFTDAHELIIDAEAHELDSDGRVVHTYVTHSKQRRIDGKLSTVVLSSTKDGVDQTKDEQERAKKRDAEDKRSESPFASPNASTPVSAGGMNTIMPWTMYAGMTPEDVGAIFDYLRTQKAITNVVERFRP